MNSFTPTKYTNTNEQKNNITKKYNEDNLVIIRNNKNRSHIRKINITHQKKYNKNSIAQDQINLMINANKQQAKKFMDKQK